MPTSDTMDQRNRAPERRRLVARVIRDMNANGSWCGETHVQKALFYVKTLLEHEAGFNFYLHYHGPFSSGVHETLQFMVGYGEIEYEPDPPYRPHIRLSKAGDELAHGDDREADIVAWVAEQLGSKGVDALEGPATVCLLRSQRHWDDDALAREIHRLKRHISIEDAMRAITEFKAMSAAADAFKRELSDHRAGAGPNRTAG